MHALVIDDEPQVRSFVSLVLSDDWEVSEAESAECAFELLGEREWALVVCDVVLGGEDGFSVLRRFKEESPSSEVVLMTGAGSASGAIDATALGAFDYLLKPFTVDELKALSRTVKERIEARALWAGGAEQTPAPAASSDVGLVGRSRSFVEIMKQVGRVAPTNLTVLLAGESGTGKELVARALHQRSRRAGNSFVAVNCGAIPAELIESELFGHARGSFTGAERDRRGLFEEADQGTIFLDEVTETAPAFQVKLLRVLQEGEIRRVGENRTRKVDVRVIAASNRDVEQDVQAGRFRKDLFYRLNAVKIYLPPLRERREDIVPLAAYFAARVRLLSPATPFSPEVVRLLEQYDWPGNVRELENVVVRAAALCQGAIHPEDLPEHIRDYSPPAAEPESKETAAPAGDEPWPTLAEAEGMYVARVLAHTGGNKQAAARILNIDRKRVDRIVKRHELASRKVVRGPASHS
ncbi:MAG TPA: sigma-54 dependent transcriptional regulator [Pyrinomonadaceae bacterium]|jgi:two-component system response regulator AtoC|nr:sigma-54 dependent transcriptional regulator [Pyrinomonadaceae bacterium]